MNHKIDLTSLSCAMTTSSKGSGVLGIPKCLITESRLEEGLQVIATFSYNNRLKVN